VKGVKERKELIPCILALMIVTLTTIAPISVTVVQIAKTVVQGVFNIV
jgi:hypothetical protein